MNKDKHAENIKSEIIAWANGRWGRPETIYIPIHNRSLLLSDGIFETLLVTNRKCKLLAEHIARWHYSAKLLGLEPPPFEYELIDLLEVLISNSTTNTGALRLNWGRGQGIERGINFSNREGFSLKDRFWILFTPVNVSFEPISAIISLHERRNYASRIIHHKILAYSQSIHVRYEARQAGVDDALMLNTRGELVCSSCSTLLIFDSGQWISPPMSAGCLSGIMRNLSIKLGIVKEEHLLVTQLIEGISNMQGPVILLNSLSCRPLFQLNGFKVIGSSPLEGSRSKAYALFQLLNNINNSSLEGN